MMIKCLTLSFPFLQFIGNFQETSGVKTGWGAGDLILAFILSNLFSSFYQYRQCTLFFTYNSNVHAYLQHYVIYKYAVIMGKKWSTLLLINLLWTKKIKHVAIMGK